MSNFDGRKKINIKKNFDIDKIKLKKMKKTNTKVPFKLNIFGFKLKTTVTEMSFIKIAVLMAMEMIFILVFFSLLREYAITGLGILAIINKISNLKILKIIKSRSP